MLRARTRTWQVRNGSVVVPHAGGEIAPRTTIGVDKSGRLQMFVVCLGWGGCERPLITPIATTVQADGIEKSYLGLTMQQAAEWTLALGGFHVINLDGGGSSTAILNGKIANHPTCIDTPLRCERPVTTVVCVK